MVFSSNIFLFFFLPTVLGLYYLIPRRFRNGILLTSSLLFYAWGEPAYVLLMLAVILLNYLSGRIIDAPNAGVKGRKHILILSITLNLLILGFFKYTGFLTESLNRILPAGLQIPVPEIPLPLGISFYVFQSMSYTIDVYRRTVKAQHNLLTFGTYVSMFPQLIAGPIVRYRDIEEQLLDRHESFTQFASGVRSFIIGLAKKMLLANRMGALCETLRATDGSLAGWICMFAYTLQIYFDFSGYSDMAIGLGRMMGFEFLPNFNYPYISQSITEFWRRWHMSLGNWFREYVYIPLGGNRRGPARQLLNIMIVWALTGLWHGASWNFVLWGLYYAVLLTLEKLLLNRKTEDARRAEKNAMPLQTGKTLGVLLMVSFGWVLFSFTDSAELKQFLFRLAAFRESSTIELQTVFAYLPLMLVATIAATPLPKKLWQRLDDGALQAALEYTGLGLLLLLCIAALAAQSYNPFIYFRF